MDTVPDRAISPQGLHPKCSPTHLAHRRPERLPARGPSSPAPVSFVAHPFCRSEVSMPASKSVKLAKPLAGGQTLLASMKLRLANPEEATTERLLGHASRLAMALRPPRRAAAPRSPGACASGTTERGSPRAGRGAVRHHRLGLVGRTPRRAGRAVDPLRCGLVASPRHDVPDQLLQEVRGIQLHGEA